jgi:TPP-dependent pyruvate/acetoin dehydrogenase alpha subunit
LDYFQGKRSEKMSANPPLKILKLYETMYLIRKVEELISSEYSKGGMRTPVHLAIGQELLPAYFAQLLNSEDLVLSGHRSHGHYLAKSGDLNSFFAEILGKQEGCSRGNGGSQHLIDLEHGFVASAPILGATVAMGVGCAWQLSIVNQQKIVVVYFGDAAIEEGIVYEAMNFAALHKLPVVFACENNMYSTHIHISRRQPPRPLTNFSQSTGIKTIHLLGESYADQFEILSSAVHDVRNSGGPCFVLIDTYRFLEHVGPNDDVNLGYRSQEELNQWKVKDPLDLVTSKILEEGLLTETELQRVKFAIDYVVLSSYKNACESRNADPEHAFEYVYPKSGRL